VNRCTLSDNSSSPSLRGAQRRGNPSSRFDKLKAPSPSRGWIATPSFLGLQMNSSYVIANLRNEGEAIHLTF
jgi:hypothetical protein